jgi:hypothetical protein
MLTKKPYLLAAGLWLAMVVVFFWPVIFQGKVLAPLDIMESLLRPWATTEEVQVHNAFTYDAISQYLPYDWSVYQSLRQDGYIGWNPYVHSGTSIVENTMLCPGGWHHHLYRFLPFWTAWNTGIILGFTFAGLGMLLLLRDQKIPAAYALIGVAAFGFFSQFTLWIYHGWVLGAMCWSPWILWSLLRARRAGRIIDLPSVAFIALAFRGGHLQTCVFVVLLVVLVAIAHWWKSDQRWNPSQVGKLLLPYTVVGILGSLLALDVVMETVPPLLQGNKDMTPRTWFTALLGLPTLVTSITPTVMGTPQGIDVMKAFASDLFSIKFMGAVPLLLAAVACFRRQAPATAKLLLVIGLLLPFTPADEWLYSRFTVVYALGGAWLAAWYLATISREPPLILWKRAFIILSIAAGVWLLGSVLVTAQQTWVEARLHDAIVAKLPADKASRADWMLARADVFINESLLWFPRNLAMLALVGLGIFACSRIHNQNRNASRFAILAALCTFGELFLFASTWVTFSAKPAGNRLYSEPGWVSQLKRETTTDNGTILSYDRSDFDFMQLNTPSAYGIRFAEGYDTVTPHRIDPILGDRFDPLRCASSGISHLLVSPEKDPGSVPGWEKVIDSSDIVLYKNPLFQGICFAEHPDGTTTPLATEFTSPNRRTIDLPAGTKAVVLLESFNPGWKYSMNSQAWQPVHESELRGIRIDLGNPTPAESTRLLLQYHPTYQSYYRPIIGGTAISLLGFSLYRRRKSLGGVCAPQSAR